MEQGLITFFDVTHCGFYRLRKRKEGECISGSLSETIKAIKDWVEGLDVEDTIPWCTVENSYRPRFYCKSVETDSNTGDTLFVFWKKHGDDSGSINGIKGKSKVGARSQDTFKITVGTDEILGNPLYYWFIPSHNLMATIKLPNSIADTENIFRYIKSCIDLRIPHPLKKTVTTSDFINPVTGDVVLKASVSYRSQNDEFSMKFKINAKLKELKIENSNPENLASKITHIVVRNTISATDESDKAAVYRLIDKFKNKKSSVSRTKKIEYTYEETPTGDELEAMINDYRDNFDPSGLPQKGNDKWENVGFKTSGPNSPTNWFDRYFDKDYVKVPKSYKQEDSYYPAKQLLTTLTKDRDQLLRFVL